jgi:hypothetical protein
MNNPRPSKNRSAHCFIYQVIAEIYFPEFTN